MTESARLQAKIDALREDTVSLLQTLVRMPSITGQEGEVGAFVADFCRRLGLEVEVLEAESGRPNVLARWKGEADGPTLLLNDHLDIVPPGPLEYWTHPPFAAEIEGGRMYGRGTIDTKSGLSTILMATRAARESGVPIRGELKLVFSCDEEVGGAKGMQFLARNGHIQADMAVVTEPTTMQIEIATKGRLELFVTTRGVATHGARPWLGHNAIDDMALVVLELQKLSEQLKTRKHPLLGHATLSVGRIEGGTVSNMVPNKCVVGLDRRVLPTESPDDAVAEVQSILADLTARVDGFDASLEQTLWWPGYMVDENEPLVEIACQAYETVMGERPTVAGKDAGTDASWINTLAGIPVVMFSPGNGFNAMNADENVMLDDLHAATKVVGQIIHDVLVQGGAAG